MAIWRRKRGGAAGSAEAPGDPEAAGDAEAPGDTLAPGEPEAPAEPNEPGAEGGESDEAGGSEEATPGDESAEPEPVFARERGPFDVDEVAPDAALLDLGALRLPAVEGIDIQVEVEDATQLVRSVTVQRQQSQAQLQAFAAPRTAPLWPQIRGEIAVSIASQGGQAQVVDGPLGRELVATMPNGGAPVRFLGIDGPRWFLRAVLTGAAASDEDAAAPLVELVRGTVVVRGGEARAPRELLPMRLPEVPATSQLPGVPDPAARPGHDDLKPFERGPEITEVR